MKRFLFYVLLLIQVGVLLFLTFQFEKIEKTGEEINIQTVSPEFPVYGDFIDGDMYVEYEINKVAEDKWGDSLPIDYNEQIYVLLKEDKQGVHRVRKASTEKLTAQNNQEFVLKGTYQYHDEEHDMHYVDYGLEHIKHADQFGTFKPNDELVVTVLIGKWGQHKITAIKKSLE